MNNPQYNPTLTVAQRAALLRAAHCEEKQLLGELDTARDQLRQNFPGAAAKITVKEAELEILHSAIRALWLS
jgi:hypothetical protein